MFAADFPTKPCAMNPQPIGSRLCHLLSDKIADNLHAIQPRAVIGTWSETCPVKTSETRPA
jgi:hypothetical protein